MSTDCESLLKKFLVLNPQRRAALEVKIEVEDNQKFIEIILGDYER